MYIAHCIQLVQCITLDNDNKELSQVCVFTTLGFLSFFYSVLFLPIKFVVKQYVTFHTPVAASYHTPHVYIF